MKKHPRLTLLTIWVAIVLLLITLNSCQTARNLPRHNDKYPLESAKYFSNRFKPKDSTIFIRDSFTTTLIKEVPKVDTFLFCDTVIHGVPAKKFTVTCPPSQISTITVTKTLEHWQEDPAKARVWELEKAGLQQTVAEQKAVIKAGEQVIQSQKNLLWKAGLLILALVVVIFHKPLGRLCKILFAIVRSFIGLPPIPPIS